MSSAVVESLPSPFQDVVDDPERTLDAWRVDALHASSVLTALLTGSPPYLPLAADHPPIAAYLRNAYVALGGPATGIRYAHGILLGSWTREMLVAAEGQDRTNWLTSALFALTVALATAHEEDWQDRALAHVGAALEIADALGV